MFMNEWLVHVFDPELLSASVGGGAGQTETPDGSNVVDQADVPLSVQVASAEAAYPNRYGCLYGFLASKGSTLR